MAQGLVDAINASGHNSAVVATLDGAAGIKLTAKFDGEDFAGATVYAAPVSVGTIAIVAGNTAVADTPAVAHVETFTVSGTIETGDSFSLTIDPANMSVTGPSVTVTYTAVAGDTATTVADALTAKINATTLVNSVTVDAVSNNNIVLTEKGTATFGVHNATVDFTATATATAGVGESDSITAATAGSLKSIPVGTKITVAGSASNNGDYIVVANTGTVLTVEGTIAGINSSVVAAKPGLTTETVAATIETTSFYKGDSNSRKHRVSKDRDFTQSLKALDPAFEKAIRAMSIIAQGVFGTTGGLDQNPGRVADARFLLNDSLTCTSPGVPTPYGTELKSNIGEVQADLGFKRILTDQTNQNHTILIGFFQARVATTENVDSLEAISRLLNEQQALEVSFQALARIRDLSLGNFLR
jgi:hypothetical protein